jgi:hypothetical protein
MLALRTYHCLTLTQFYPLQDFAEAVIDRGRRDYGQRRQARRKWPSVPPSDIIIGIHERECPIEEDARVRQRGDVAVKRYGPCLANRSADLEIETDRTWLQQSQDCGGRSMRGYEG